MSKSYCEIEDLLRRLKGASRLVGGLKEFSHDNCFDDICWFVSCSMEDLIDEVIKIEKAELQSSFQKNNMEVN